MLKSLQLLWQRWFARRFPLQQGVTTVRNNRVYILPTKLGWGFVLALVVLVMLGINYSNNLIYGLAFWLAGIALVALVQTQRQLPGLSLQLLPITPVFAGEVLQLNVKTTSPERRTARGLALSLAWPNEKVPVERVHIDAHATQTLSFALPTQTRGRFSAPLLRISSNYPLGLFQSWSFIHQQQNTVIYPRPLESADLPPSMPQQSGTNATARQAGSDEYDGLRRYRPGDAMRHVAWKSVAQKASLRADGKPTVDDLLSKSFVAEAAEVLLLDLPTARAVTTDTEAALGLLCRWLLDARAQGAGYQLAFEPKDEFTDSELAALALFGDGYDDSYGNG